MRLLPALYMTFGLMIGCATTPHDQFSKIQIGMDKDQVLNLMESPQRTQRWHGLDRWTYVYYNENQRIEKEVQFDDGIARYVGDTFKPAVSAEEQDALNENSNREVDAILQSRKEDSQKQYSDYENRVQGNQEVRYVPQFQPIQ